MQAVGQFVKRSARAKGYGLKSTYARTSTGKVLKVPSSYRTFATRGVSGKPRRTLTRPQIAQSSTKRAITVAMNKGRFSEIPSSGAEGLTLKQNMIQFAEAVKAPPFLISKLRATDPDRLHAMMTVNDWMVDQYFTYDDGLDYGDAVHSSAWDNIEMVVTQYDRVFGPTYVQQVFR
jgi:hypothetical protein